MKTGTLLTSNQIRASNIREITGVDLIVTRMGCKNALNLLLIPAMIPSVIASTNEIKKPIIPRKIVAPMIERKFASVNNFPTAIIVFSGEGRISSESIIMEPAFHKATRKITDRIV
jgi:hypothetical protein